MNDAQRLRFEAAVHEIAKVKAEVGEDVGAMAKTGAAAVRLDEFAKLCTEYAKLEAALAIMEKT